MKPHLSKSRRARSAEHLLGADLVDAVGEGEGEVLGDELLDIGALDIFALLNLHNLEDLWQFVSESNFFLNEQSRFRTWMLLKRARWRAAMSE